MAETKDAQALEHYWDEWRRQSGKLMIDDFEEYITLLNTAAKANGTYECVCVCYTSCPQIFNYVHSFLYIIYIFPISGFNDAGEMWVDVYTEPTLNYTSQDFKSEIETLWKELEEFYKDLHGYVRFRLKEHYDVIDSEFIPAHLLGMTQWRPFLFSYLLLYFLVYVPLTLKKLGKMYLVSK